jgi:hypothetical protein
VPVISNLEDLYKIPRLQKVQQEEHHRKRAAKLTALRKRLEAEEEASQVATRQNMPSPGAMHLNDRPLDASIVDLD